jgi:hypothetical protein
VRMYACMYVCMYVCMHACMYVCMYVFMYVCMYDACVFVALTQLYICSDGISVIQFVRSFGVYHSTCLSERMRLSYYTFVKTA